MGPLSWHNGKTVPTQPRLRALGPECENGFWNLPPPGWLEAPHPSPPQLRLRRLQFAGEVEGPAAGSAPESSASNQSYF